MLGKVWWHVHIVAMMHYAKEVDNGGGRVVVDEDDHDHHHDIYSSTTSFIYSVPALPSILLLYQHMDDSTNTTHLQ